MAEVSGQVGSSLASVTCPAPGCDLGDDDGPLVLKDTTMAGALRARDRHLRLIHPGFKPVRGSI